MEELAIIPSSLLVEYKKAVGKNVYQAFKNLHDSELSINTFSFYISVSAVFSSKIEGENIELDSYIKHKKMGVKFLPDYTRKIDDLYNAYQFAQSAKLTAKNVEKAHKLITKNILQASERGKVRTGNMYVTTRGGRIEYVAATPVELKPALQALYRDIQWLVDAELGFAEVFFFASMIHLVFVKIHPFNDGNGRTARLLEKWFIAEKLGTQAWFIQSERHYYEHHLTYFKNIRALGLEYAFLNYSQAIPFVLMLPAAL